jgi:hypothetical protein
MKKESDSLTMTSVKEMMKDSYQLAYVDYRDSLDEHLDLIQECIDNKDITPLTYKCDEWFWESKAASVDDIYEDLLNKCVRSHGMKEAYKFFSDNEDAIRDEIGERDSSNEIRDLLSNTSDIPVRIELVTDNDCYDSTYDESRRQQTYWNRYLGDMADVLRLNPARLKEVMIKRGFDVQGRFPDKKYRNGREKVDYDDFLDELESTTCGSNLLTFIMRLRPVDLYDNGFDIRNIVIPEGNLCGLYSSIYGGGGCMEIKLKQKVKIRIADENKKHMYFRISVDGNRKNKGEYTIKDCYGVISEFFGSTAEINTRINI